MAVTVKQMSVRYYLGGTSVHTMVARQLLTVATKGKRPV